MRWRRAPHRRVFAHDRGAAFRLRRRGLRLCCGGRRRHDRRDPLGLSHGRPIAAPSRGGAGRKRGVVSDGGAPISTRRRGALAALPLVVFAALAALLYWRLYAGDASRIPSALIGQSAPALDLPGLEGAPGIADADLRQGHVTLVNIFASWCAPCHAEHELLMGLAADPALKA